MSYDPFQALYSRTGGVLSLLLTTIESTYPTVCLCVCARNHIKSLLRVALIMSLLTHSHSKKKRKKIFWLVSSPSLLVQSYCQPPFFKSFIDICELQVTRDFPARVWWHQLGIMNSMNSPIVTSIYYSYLRSRRWTPTPGALALIFLLSAKVASRRYKRPSVRALFVSQRSRDIWSGHGVSTLFGKDSAWVRLVYSQPTSNHLLIVTVVDGW